MNGFSIRLIAATALVTLACGPASEEDSDGAGSAVVGGTRTNDAPAVGYLAVNGFPFCTGTLVAPNLVLTAAHCVDAYKQSGGEFTFGFGDVADRRRSVVAKYATHPTWRGFDPKATAPGEHDMAYLILAKRVTDVEPARLGRSQFSGGCTYRSLGYGISTKGYVVGDQGAESGTRKALDQCATPMLVKKTIEVAASEGSICQGDSGGPLLLRSKSTMLGVASYISVLDKGKDRGCRGDVRGHYTTIAANLTFVDAAIASAQAFRDVTSPKTNSADAGTDAGEEWTDPDPDTADPDPDPDPDPGPDPDPEPDPDPDPDPAVPDAGAPAPGTGTKGSSDAGAKSNGTPDLPSSGTQSETTSPTIEVSEHETEDPAKEEREERASEASSGKADAGSCSASPLPRRSSSALPLLGAALILASRRRRQRR